MPHTPRDRLSSYNDANPMGALDVVADAADMAMDEGERNVTLWTMATELGEMRSQVSANTHAIEVRRCSELKRYATPPRIGLTVPCVRAGAARAACGPRCG